MALTRTAPSDPRLVLHIQELTLAFDRRSWHGPNLMGALRGVTPAGAVWRPQPQRHNVAEIVVHCAYWKYRVCRLLDPARHTGFTVPGSDWFGREREMSRADLKADSDLLREWHGHLIAEIRRIDPDDLDRQAGTGKFTVSELLCGAAAHDVYHAGQIRLLRRMCGSAGGS